jgi:hypothetical protein
MVRHYRAFAPFMSAFGALLASTLLFGHLAAQNEPAKGKEEEARQEQQLKNMKRSVRQYTASLGDDRNHKLTLQEDALIRYSNPVFGTKDGAIFLWCDNGRPQAIVKLHTQDNEFFAHEWQSLSESSIVVERGEKIVWNPTTAGIKFREVPEAPKPAESATECLRQMKSLAGKFSATYKQVDEPKPADLRLLIQPIFRYERNKDAKYLDGAIFGFSLGTAPLALLLLEARHTGDTRRWFYGFARTGTGPTAASYGDKEIYSVERYDFKRDPTQPFFWMPRQPVPKE